MNIKVWGCDSDSTSYFMQTARNLVDVLEYESLEALYTHLEESDVIFLDYDEDPKAVDKFIKELRKEDADVFIMLGANTLNPKKLQKHQKGKYCADLYLKTPLTEAFFEAVLATHFNIKVKGPRMKSVDIKPTDVSMPNQRPQEFRGNENIEEVDELNMDEELSLSADETNSFDISDTLEATDSLDLSEDSSLNLSIEDNSLLDLGDDFPLELGDDDSLSVASVDEDSSLDLGDDTPLELGDEIPMMDASEEDISLDLSDDELTPQEQSLALSEETKDLSRGIQEKFNMAYENNRDAEKVLSEIKKQEAEESSQDVGELDIDKDSDSSELVSSQDDDLSLDEVFGDSSIDELSDLGEGLDDSMFSGLDELTRELEVGGSSLSMSLGDESEEKEDESIEAIQDDSEKESAMSSDSIKDNELSLDNMDELELGDDDGPLSEQVAIDEGALELSLDDSMDLELGGAENDEDDFVLPTQAPDLGLGDVSLDDELSFGSEASADEDSSEQMTGSFGNVPDQSEDELEFTANDDEGEYLDENQVPTNPDFTVSESFKEKMSEIDKMLAGDGSKPSKVAEVSELLEASNYDEKTSITQVDGVSNFSNKEETEKVHNQDSDEEFEPKFSVEEDNNQTQKANLGNKQSNIVSMDVIKEQREISKFRDSEFERLGETISALRADRESLLARVEELEGMKTDENRQTIDLRAQLDEKKIELTLLRKRSDNNLNDIKYQLELMSDRKEMLEEKNRQLALEVERLGRKVRVDISKVKNREKELESKLELLRADSQVQIQNRDQKILELKRKIDTMEFDMEGILAKEKNILSNNYERDEKMGKVISLLKTTLGELEEDSQMSKALKEVKKTLDI